MKSIIGISFATAMTFTASRASFLTRSIARKSNNVASSIAVKQRTTSFRRFPSSTRHHPGWLAMIATDASTSSTTTTIETSNPLLQNKGLPKFESIKPKDLSPAVKHLLSQLERDFDSMEKSATPSYDRVLPELERLQFGLEYAWGIAGHLNGVQNDDELRDAYEENQPLVIRAITKIAQSKPLFDALSGIKETWNEQDSSFEFSQKRRAVENSLHAMTLGGVGLEGETKERFNEMTTRMAQLGTTFSNNVLDCTKEFSLTVEDATIMEKVPASAKAMWANAHAMYTQQQQKEQDKENDTPDEKMDPDVGPWRITLDMPSYIAAMSHLPDRELREQIYKAHITRASDKSNDDKNNIPLIYEILKMRREMAQMLGYDNYAEQSLSAKMAPSVESVKELSNYIADKAVPAAAKELEEITNYANEHGAGELKKLMPWDITFWSERYKEDKFDLTEEELRPYFALDAVLQGMFDLVKRLFGIDVRAADGDAECWHPDVRFFKIYDGDTHIASFYLDPYSRPENKRGGAWMDVCVGKSKAVERDIPVAYLVCNGSPPVGDDTPSLLTFREVETLFHEFGHGLQHMLTKANVGDVAGINGIEWDAVELPSQFMENWCYDKATVYGFAKHYKTGEPLPVEIFDKLVAQKTFQAGMMACRQLLFGQLDMELHSNYDPEKKDQESIFDVQRRLAERYTPHNMPLEEDRFLCGFSHIFAGGYAAGYYSYKWAEVMSADAFAAFEEAGLENDEEIEKVGQKFRDTVLSLGGGVPPMDVFKQFRGREPSPEALMRHNGLLGEEEN